MDIRVGDILIMKKNHPCGNSEFRVLRSGMDFKLECKKCGHIVMVPRLKAEKNSLLGRFSNFSGKPC